MEPPNKSSSKTPDAALSTLRTWNKKLTLFFVVFFLTLFLLMASLIIYLVLDIGLESSRETASLSSGQLTYTDNHNLTDSLQTAAKQLENVTSFIDSRSDPNADSVLKNCSNLLRRCLGQIMFVLKAESDKQVMSEMKKRIETVQSNLNACLDDLVKVESKVEIEVQSKVMQVFVTVANIAVTINNEGNLQKSPWSGIHWRDMINFENLFMTFLVGIQLFFIGFMFWNVYRFR